MSKDEHFEAQLAAIMSMIRELAMQHAETYAGTLQTHLKELQAELRQSARKSSLQ